MSAGHESARPLEEPIVDPITFEVIKHRLWQINDEQGIAIKTISSSPVVVEGNDFNVGLFTADGQLSTAGAGSLVHVGTMGKTLKSILELAGEIEDGDVFLTNDPFLGALHQSDARGRQPAVPRRPDSALGGRTCCTIPMSAASTKAVSASAPATSTRNRRATF